MKRPALKGAVLSKLETVEAVIVSDRVMAAVHKRFLNERGPTDVITFDHGEILIGVQTARTNAAKYKNPLTVEIGLYIIHGLLHLHGYTDLQKTEAKMMEKMQASILNACLKRLKED